jgi:hypothetical protein
MSRWPSRGISGAPAEQVGGMVVLGMSACLDWGVRAGPEGWAMAGHDAAGDGEHAAAAGLQ